MKGISFLLACSPVIFGEKLPKDAPERVEIRFIPGYKRGEEPDRHSRHKRETNHQSGNTILDDYGFFYGESCGDKPTAQYRMMGGEEANIEEYPWQLYLTLGAENLNGPFSYKCGATVISNWYALTSAGCICPRGVKIPGLYSATCMKPELSGMINSMSTITCKTMRSDPNNATAPSDTEDYGQYSFNDERIVLKIGNIKYE